MTGTKVGLVLKITFIMSILNFSLWGTIKEMTGFGIWYYGNAMAYVGYIYVIYEFTRILYRTEKKYSNLLTWAEVALGAAISNLMDELFFDPTKLGVNEYIGFTVIVVIAIYNDYKRKK